MAIFQEGDAKKEINGKECISKVQQGKNQGRIWKSVHI